MLAIRILCKILTFEPVSGTQLLISAHHLRGIHKHIGYTYTSNTHMMKNPLRRTSEHVSFILNPLNTSFIFSERRKLRFSSPRFEQNSSPLRLVNRSENYTGQ